MENIKDITLIEINKMLNDCSIEHKKIKQEIIDYTYQVDELEKTINSKLNELSMIEHKYVMLIEELEKR